MIGVIVNPHAGFVSKQGVDTLQALILEAIPEACIHVLKKHDDIALRCERFLRAGATCIAAAGGDGTVNAVAATLVGTGTPLGVIPGGTLNHFARDVGVGRDVPEALRTLAGGYALPVDVASVNDRIFLNNSSIGLYPQLIQLRERYEQHLGKWHAMLRAGVLVARDAHSTIVRISDNHSSEEIRSYLLFVGNNQYELNLLHLGQRACLTAGQLCCFVLEAPSRLQLLPHVFNLLRGTSPTAHVFRSLSATELTVTPHHGRTVEVSADGEVFRLPTPLIYRAMPGALRVVVPEPPPPASREARDALQ